MDGSGGPPLLKACLNGGRSRAEHPGVPLTPEELAAEARAAVAAGASAVHVHPRDEHGNETLEPAACDAAVAAIRGACPGVPLGLTTGAWIAPHPDRLDMIAAWTERPEFASVNFSEDGAAELAEDLLRLGVGVEAGLSEPADAEAFLGSGLAGRCLRVLLEPQEPGAADALAAAEAVESALDRAGLGLPRLLHGVDGTAWPVMAAALARGLDVRIGLEDTLRMQDGTAAQGNGALVAAALELAGRGRRR